MKRALIKTIDFYRAALSPIAAALGARCRFHPSCSEYARGAIERFPLPKAASLIAARLLKCGPWHGGGVDYLPTGEKG
ncbi:MAG: membrane protein insertion efficiency factor YidD [Proteobacteria bacterium]|nr:membrane protein insertion efficiency factor YidD [Pseudomonadota bacterium]